MLRPMSILRTSHLRDGRTRQQTLSESWLRRTIVFDCTRMAGSTETDKRTPRLSRLVGASMFCEAAQLTDGATLSWQLSCLDRW
eukprot:SAG22_NODE_546_length_9261_cov_18.423925_10_plen_84_part_00